MTHYEIHTQDHEEKSTADLSMKQFQKLSKELAKQKKLVDAQKKDRESLISEKAKLKSENKSLEKALKKTNSKGELYRMSRKQQSAEDGLLGVEEMRLRMRELEDQLAERDYKITAMRLTIERNSELALGGDSIMEVDTEKPSGSIGGTKRTTNGGILDPTAALERLLEEQDMSLKLRKENAELRAHILALDMAEWERLHKDSDPSPKSPRKRSSGFFKRGKKSTSSMPSRRVSEETSHDNSRPLKRSQSPDITASGKSDANQEVEVSDTLILSRFNKDSTSSLPGCNSPSHSPQMAMRSRTNSDLVTLQACLKLAISEKNTFKENSTSLQRELESVEGRLKEVEKDLEVKMEEAMKKAQKSLETVEIDRDTYRDELKISQQEVEDMLEKQRSMEKSHVEVVRAKVCRIKELEAKLESFQKMQHSGVLGGSSYNVTSPKKTSAVGASKETPFSPTRVGKESSSSEVVSPMKLGSGSAANSSFSPQLSSEPVKPTNVTSPNITPVTSLTRTTVTSPTRPTVTSPTRPIVTSPTRPVTSPTRPSVTSPTRPVTSPTRPTVTSPTRHHSSGSHFSSKSESKLQAATVPTQTPELPSKQVPSYVRKLSKDFSSEKPLESSSTSSAPTKKIGKLSQEPSTEKFEVAAAATKDPPPPPSSSKRKNSNTVLPPPSPSSAFAKVAATRAMFEQKIDQTKSSNAQTRRPFRSTSESADDKRRFSLGGGSGTSSENNKCRSTVLHSKSNSYDLSAKPPSGSKISGSSIDKVLEVAPTGSSSNNNRHTHLPSVVPPPTSDKDKPNGPTGMTNEDKSKTDSISHQQHDKKFIKSRSSTAPSVVGTTSSTVAGKTADNLQPASTRVASPTKVSKITITSTSSPTVSPLPSSRKDPSLSFSSSSSSKVGGSFFIRNLTSPNLGARTPSPTSSSSSSRVLLCGQPSSSGSSSKVVVPMRKSGPSKTQDIAPNTGTSLSSSPSDSTSASLSHSRGHGSNFRLQQSTGSVWSKPEKVFSSSVSVTSPKSSGFSSTSSSSPSSSSSSSFSSSSAASSSSCTKPHCQVSGSKSVVTSSSSSSGQKISSSLSTDTKLNSPVAKMGSLQNIQSYTNGTAAAEDSSTSQAQVNTAAAGILPSASTPSVTAATGSGTRRGPTHRAMQRRDRKDRPKTMYAGRAETTNLVNLISKFQEEEKKNQKETKSSNAVVVGGSQFSQPPASNKPLVNGSSSSVLSSSMVVTNSSSSSSSAFSSSSSNVPMRQNLPSSSSHRPRPATFYLAESKSSRYE